MKYVITMSYDGSKFLGFQREKSGPSVQDVIEKALTKIDKENVFINGAGRTDRGVHALGQTASFELKHAIEPERVKNALNSLVGPYICIKDCKEVPIDFHARFSVKRKKYTYKINLGAYNPIMADYVYQCPYKLDLHTMKKCSKLFLGVHDFRNFVSGDRKNYDAIIYSIKFKKIGSILEISFVGKSFYRYMVRNIVGALIEVGRGKEGIKTVNEMLALSIKKTLYTAPSCGLYLDFIEY